MKGIKVNILTLWTLLSICQVYGQYSNAVDSVEQIKNIMRRNGKVEALYVGLHAERSRQCERFLFIAKRSGEAQMKSLLNDSSSCLRLYAYCYLRSMYHLELRQEKQRLRKDTSAVYYFRNCMGGWMQVKDVRELMVQWEETQYFRYWLDNVSWGSQLNFRKLLTE